jgi:type VI secretion system protein ImpM
MDFNLFKPRRAPIGCFGKLPIYADFIKLRSENMELGLLDKWIQEGIHFAQTRLGNDFKTYYNRALYYNFIYQPKNSDKSIAGILSPGADKSGRCFPFVIFVSVNKQRINNQMGMFLSHLQKTFFADALDIATFGWNGLEPNVFLKRYFNREVLLGFDNAYKKDYHAVIKTKTIASYFKNLRKDLTCDKINIIINNLLDVVKPLSKENYSRFSLGIKFPISAQPRMNGFEITFWIDLLLRVFPEKNIFPSLFWTNRGDEVASNLLFYVNEPLPKQFISLLNVESETDENLCELTETGFSAADDTEDIKKHGSYKFVKDSEATLYDLLNSLK